VEIGAFVNDTCVGASMVESTDSVIVVSAYLGEHPGDSVVFEQYYGSEKSAGKRIKDYHVQTPFESRKQQRIVKTGEKSNVFIISLSGEIEKPLTTDKEISFEIYPNPASGKLFYSLTIKDKAFVSILITDIAGKLVAAPLNESINTGIVRGEIELKSFSGDKLKPGIYLITVKTGELIKTKKVIVK